ncbi:hypothetical protein GCM10027168_44210 [Streptomyces capparidis]
MATLLRQQVIELPVAFGGFALQDADDLEVPCRFPDERASLGADLLTTFEGRIDVESAGHTHQAPLTAEIWDGEPPADDREAWDVRGDTEIRSRAGALAVWVVTGARLELIHLGEKNMLWGVRVYCCGREEVARLASVEVPEGVERYLVQFWPARS